MKSLDPTVRPSVPEFDVHLTENVLVAMRDGVRLATDVYRPARDGRPLADAAPRPPAPHALQQDGNRGHARPVPLVRRTRLRGRQPGLPRLLPLGRGRQLPGARGRGRRRHHRVDPSPGVVRTARWAPSGPRGPAGRRPPWPRSGPRASRRWWPNMSGADGHESSVRHGGALELRFLAWAFWHSAYNSQAALKAAPFVTPALNARRPALLGLARADAHPARPDPARPGAALREVGARDPHARRLRRLLEAPERQSRARTGIASRRCPSCSSAAGTTRTRAPPSRTSSGSEPTAGGRCAS